LSSSSFAKGISNGYRRGGIVHLNKWSSSTKAGVVGGFGTHIISDICQAA